MDTPAGEDGTQVALEQGAAPHPQYADVVLRDYVHLTAAGGDGPIHVYGQVRGITILLDNHEQLYHQVLVRGQNLGRAGEGTFGEPLWELVEISKESFDGDS